MKGEESSYSKELEQATNGITRKEMKQIECVQQRKNNGLIISHKLKNTIREMNREPNQWNEGIICPMYKNGDRLGCTNYRPITLLNVTYKIFATILNQRPVDVVETKSGGYQSGFRPKRSTIDNIFMVRQIMEKCYE